MWLADFRQYMQEGNATDDRDGSIMKTLVEAIIVWDDRIEVRFKCGATVEQKYVERTTPSAAGAINRQPRVFFRCV